MPNRARMTMRGMGTVPTECQGLDFDKAMERLPSKVGGLFLAAGEQRLRELSLAMAASDPKAVMDAAHSLASLTGLVPVQALAYYVWEIYAAGDQADLPSASHAFERLALVLGWIFANLRDRGYETNAS